MYEHFSSQTYKFCCGAIHIKKLSYDLSNNIRTCSVLNVWLHFTAFWESKWKTSRDSDEFFTWFRRKAEKCSHTWKTLQLRMLLQMINICSPADLCKNCARQRRNTKFGINILWDVELKETFQKKLYFRFDREKSKMADIFFKNIQISQKR